MINEFEYLAWVCVCVQKKKKRERGGANGGMYEKGDAFWNKRASVEQWPIFTSGPKFWKKNKNADSFVAES